MNLLIEILYFLLRVFVFFYFMVMVNQTSPPGDWSSLSRSDKLQMLLIFPLLGCAPLCAFAGAIAGGCWFALMWDGAKP
jgi:hypothetical protein